MAIDQLGLDSGSVVFSLETETLPAVVPEAPPEVLPDTPLAPPSPDPEREKNPFRKPDWGKPGEEPTPKG